MTFTQSNFALWMCQCCFRYARICPSDYAANVFGSLIYTYAYDCNVLLALDTIEAKKFACAHCAYKYLLKCLCVCLGIYGCHWRLSDVCWPPMKNVSTWYDLYPWHTLPHIAQMSTLRLYKTMIIYDFGFERLHTMPKNILTELFQNVGLLLLSKLTQ